MKSAIVTGSSGFIGRHLVRRLTAMGVRVSAIDRVPVDPETSRFLPAPHMQVTADLDDGSRTLDIITAPSIAEINTLATPGLPDVVFHLAATAGVHASSDDLIRDNIRAAHYVIKWCADNGVWLVFASSGAIYTQPPRRSFYGLTKWFGEEMIGTMIPDGTGTNASICRFSNVYGHQLEPKAVVGTWIDKIRRGEPIEIHGDGRQARDFIHVDDIVSGLIETAGTPGVFDLCTGRAVTINALHGMFQEILGRQVHARWLASAPVGATTPLSEVCKTLDWVAGVGLEAGLRRTFDQHGLV